MDILLKNGTIITSTERLEADVYISDGKITKIEKGLLASKSTDRIIDASNSYIFPGGIDPHVHLNLPTPAGFSSDNFATGSKAALYGGTTCLIDFVTPKNGQSLPDALLQRKAEANNSHCDYSFHLTPIAWTENTEQEIKACINAGITSFKVYMAYKESIGLDNSAIFKVMKTVGKAGGIVTLHCELGDEITKLRNELAANGKVLPEYHPISRPAYTEAEAVKEAILLADKAQCPIYIVHTSSAESLKYIAEAQQKGQTVYSETCPQYLLLNDSKYLGEFNDAAAYIMSPPLRKQKDNDALWKAIVAGTVKTVGTDHCPFNLIQKQKGISDFRMIPNGAGGIEHRMALLYTFGVVSGKINLHQFVNITSTWAAKIFGLFPLKGDIAVGSDADLLVWNPKTKNIISASTHHQNCDLNIYENIETLGAPEFVIAKGEILIENGEFTAPVQKANFIFRKI